MNGKAFLALAAMVGVGALIAIGSSGASHAVAKPLVYVGTNTACNGATPRKPTLQQGVDFVDAGGTVKVCPGTFTENVNVWKSVIIKAMKAAPDTLSCNDNRTDPNPAKYAVLDGMGGGGIGLDITASGVTVDGLIIQNFDTGIQTSDSFSGYILKNNLIQDNSTNGMALDSNGTTTVQTNCFRSTGTGIFNGIQLKSATISQNHFFQNSSYDVLLTSSTSVTLSQNMSRESYSFLYAYSSTKLSVKQNNVQDSTDDSSPFSGALYFGGGDTTLTVQGNIIQNNAGNGVVFDNIGLPANTGTMSGNIVNKNGLNGLLITPGDPNFNSTAKMTFSGNIFQGNLEDGIRVEPQQLQLTAATKSTFTGNIASGAVSPNHDCYDTNTPRNTWTGSTNIGQIARPKVICFPGTSAGGP